MSDDRSEREKPLRTIAFPAHVHSLRLARDWLRTLLAKSQLPYPVTTNAQLVLQAVTIFFKESVYNNYVESGKLIYASMKEVGLVPLGLPEMKREENGCMACTLFRDMYIVFVLVPMVGLFDFLHHMMRGGFMNNEDEVLSVGRVPAVMPAALEYQATAIHVWSRRRDSKCTWMFAAGGSTDNGLERLVG